MRARRRRPPVSPGTGSTWRFDCVLSPESDRPATSTFRLARCSSSQACAGNPLEPYHGTGPVAYGREVRSRLVDSAGRGIDSCAVRAESSAARCPKDYDSRNQEPEEPAASTPRLVLEPASSRCDSSKDRRLHVDHRLARTDNWMSGQVTEASTSANPTAAVGDTNEAEHPPVAWSRTRGSADRDRPASESDRSCGGVG